MIKAFDEAKCCIGMLIWIKIFKKVKIKKKKTLIKNWKMLA